MPISFSRLFAKYLQFFSQNLCNLFPYVKRFQNRKILSKSDNWKWVKIKDLVFYRKKQSFRQCTWGLRQIVLKPGFRPKGLWLCRKSQKISTASDQYFLSYVKQTTGWGQFDPPPPTSRNRVKIIYKRSSNKADRGRSWSVLFYWPIKLSSIQTSQFLLLHCFILDVHIRLVLNVN